MRASSVQGLRNMNLLLPKVTDSQLQVKCCSKKIEKVTLLSIDISGIYSPPNRQINCKKTTPLNLEKCKRHPDPSTWLQKEAPPLCLHLPRMGSNIPNTLR